MEERFYGFGQLTRPDIGLVADGVLNLAEIYTSDQRTALRNVFLEPEILDIIYNLSRSITREDLRAASGLTSPLLQTLDLQSETFANINDSLDEYISASTPIGVDPDNRSLSGADVRLNHTILYSGALHCEGAQYETRSLDQNSLTGSGVRTPTAISTSRASLFNSEKDENTGAFLKAYLSDSIRVRRRSHVNRIEVNPLTFIPKPEVLENPTHKILCWINDTTGAPQDSKKMQLLAVKNSPVRLPCRFSKGKIIFTFKSTGVNFYGFKIQPLQTKGNGDDVQFLSVPSQSMAADRNSFELDLDISKTGYANTFDLYLYLYMNVEEVASITFEGIGITDFQDNQDIGLIGFNRLESLNLSGTRLRYLPIWLKTLDGTIKSLDFSGSADTFVDGPFRYFDYRLRNASASTSIPLYTGISYLTIPKLGAIINEEGNDWNDELFRKYIHSQVLSGESIDDGDVEQRSFANPKEFRRFSALQSLKLGWKFFGKNPRLDDVFPDLREVEWYGTIGETRTRFPIQGTPIRIGYPGQGKSVRYISYLSGAAGTITDIGTSSDPQDVSTSAGDPTYIGAYEFSAFDISGRDNGAENDYYQEISGFIANPAEAGSWNGWLEKTGTIRINYTRCKIDLQTSEWKSLSTLQIDHSNGVVLKVSNSKNSDPISASLLGGLNVYSGNCSGHLPSLGSIQNTNNLKSYGFGGNNPNLNTFSYTINSKTFNYFLPENFAPIRNKGEEHKLESFSFQDGRSGRLPEGRLRYDDFDNLPNLKTIRLHRSPNIKGVFPNIPEVIEPDKNSKEISVTLYEDCGIYDITSLGINDGRGVARDIKELIAWSLNSSNGGCISPDLKGRTDSKITDLKLTGLRTYYPSSWQPNSSLSGKLILDDDLPSVVGSLTYNKFDPTTESSKFSPEDIIHYFQGNGSKKLKQYVLVNDRVSLGSKTSAIATVLSVENDRIYIRVDSGSELTDGSTNTYNFYRQTQDVGGWFKNGFKDIITLHMNNNRLSGELDITAGFSKITGNDGFIMYDNGLTSITKQTFESIFKGSNRNITLKFSRNNFSAVTLKSIVQRLLEVQEATKFTTVKVYLDNCKLSNGSYSPYSRSEIFKTESQDLPDETIPLTSFVYVAVFKEVITTDPETGESNPPQLIENGRKQIQVSGKDVFGDRKYYTSQVNKKIKAVEDPLANKWRKSKWDIILDFPKSDVPNTSPQTLSTSYKAFDKNGNEVIGGLTQAQFYELNNIDPDLVR